MIPNDSAVTALGSYAGVRKILLRGRNASITTSAETIYRSSNAYSRLSSAVAMEVVSSSADDAAAGTGARTVVVVGLDSNYEEVTQTATMNGATPVALSTNLLAVNDFYVATAGSGGVNAGTCQVRTVSGSTVQSTLAIDSPFGTGQAADFIYTIPSNHVGVLKCVRYSGATITGDLTVFIQTISSDGVIKRIGCDTSSLYVTGFNGAQGYIDFFSGIRIEEKTQIQAMVLASAGVGAVVAMGELLVLEQGVCPWVEP